MLRLLNEKDEPLMRDYELAEADLRFTKMPAHRFALSFGHVDEYCVGYVVNGALIGFFALKVTDEVFKANQPHAILLRSLSVDARYQGKGHAKAMISALPDFIHTQISGDIRLIAFGVAETNLAARKLCETQGYHYTGRTLCGRAGKNLVMEKRI